jgi:hypothetical protein
MMTSEATFMVSVATVSFQCYELGEAKPVGILYQAFHGGGMYES